MIITEQDYNEVKNNGKPNIDIEKAVIEKMFHQFEGKGLSDEICARIIIGLMAAMITGAQVTLNKTRS